MARSQLRIYRGPEECEVADAPRASRQVTGRVADILPLLADAVANRRTWLADFADEEIALSSDLYEVLMAYQYFRRPSA